MPGEFGDSDAVDDEQLRAPLLPALLMLQQFIIAILLASVVIGAAIGVFLRSVDFLTRICLYLVARAFWFVTNVIMSSIFFIPYFLFITLRYGGLYTRLLSVLRWVVEEYPFASVPTADFFAPLSTAQAVD